MEDLPFQIAETAHALRKSFDRRASVLGIAESRYRLDEDDAAMQAWELATQAPETPLAWLAWRRVRQSIAIPPLTCNVCPVT